MQSVIHYNAVDTGKSLDRQRVFCKRDNTISRIKNLSCDKCSYYRGIGQGDVVSCAWEDEREDGRREVYIPATDTNKELLRVAALIDRGILKRG